MCVTYRTETASTSVSAHNSQSIIGLTLSIAITATISATPLNFFCASARHCTVTAHTSTRNTSPEWKNNLRKQAVAVACAVLSALQRSFSSKQGFGADGTRQIPSSVRARISCQQSQHIDLQVRRRLGHRP